MSIGWIDTPCDDTTDGILAASEVRTHRFRHDFQQTVGRIDFPQHLDRIDVDINDLRRVGTRME